MPLDRLLDGRTLCHPERGRFYVDEISPFMRMMFVEDAFQLHVLFVTVQGSTAGYQPGNTAPGLF